MKTKSNAKNKITASGKNIGVKINLMIFLGVAVFCAFILPNLVIRRGFPEEVRPDYEHESFTYPLLNDICPCTENGDYEYDSCAGYYACRTNTIYNFDDVPDDLLKNAKRDAYFEARIDAVGSRASAAQTWAIVDSCYALSAISLIAGVIYGIHNLTKNEH